MKIVTLILLSTLAAPVAVGQTVYKCPQPDGRAGYQQQPCTITGEGEKVKIDAPKASGEGGLREGEKDASQNSDPGLARSTSTSEKN